MERTLIRRRLATLGGQTELTERQVARLSVLAALHDIGKANHGFQNKATGAGPLAGHVDEALSFFGGGADQQDRSALVQATDFATLAGWAGEHELITLLSASIAHHGRPRALPPRFNPKLWRPAGGRDPFAGIAAIAAGARRWFPEAFEPGGAPLPSAPEFQHAFGGLVTLADWLGSDARRFFPFSQPGDVDRFLTAKQSALRALDAIGIDLSAAVASLGSKPVDFSRISPHPPRDIQTQVMTLPIDPEGSVSVLEAETGSGKTEAVLARFVRLLQAGVVDGMYFALPTRTAATQLHRRVAEAAERAFPDPTTRPPVILAVPGYLSVDDRVGTRLPGFEVLWDDDPRTRWRFRGWAAEHPKRYLAGAIAVGTVDQVLLSALAVRHAHLRATSLLRHLLVVDEVHASDAYMTRLLETVLARHLSAGGHALLLSATLGAAARQALLHPGRRLPVPDLHAALAAPYPLVTHRPRGGPAKAITAAAPGNPKRVTTSLEAALSDPDRVASLALSAAREGARVLVIRNTVDSCVSTQLALEGMAADTSLLLCCGGVPAPHHSRYAREDRQALDAAIEAAFGRSSPTDGRIAVATQTVQQSLDLDADLMITDLCPMDVLLQRIGRLHRHRGRQRPMGYERPRAVVLVPEDRDMSGMLHQDGTARGPGGLGTVYEDLCILEATWRQLEERGVLEVPGESRALVERSTHPRALAALAAALGERWVAHRNHLRGEYAAQKAQARLSLVDWSADYCSAGFPDGLDRRVTTRLGEDDRLVDLPERTLGPFGHPITRLTVNGRWLRGVPGDASASLTQVTKTGLRLSLGDVDLCYNRLGLRRMERDDNAR